MRSTTAPSMARTPAATLEDAPRKIWSARTADVPATRAPQRDESATHDDGLGAARGVAVAIAAGTAIWLAIGAGAFAVFQLLS